MERSVTPWGLLLCIILSVEISSVPLNTSSTLNPLYFQETIHNPFYPFAYEVSPILSYIVANETLRKNFTIGNPYEDLKQILKGETSYWKVAYCGVHFINKGEGYILSDDGFDEEDTQGRCVWGFVGNQFCTPEITCPVFESRRGNCRSNYLQMTDSGLTFLHHFCDDKHAPGANESYTAKEGVLDVVYRYNNFRKRPQFECWVRCVNYQVNFTATGSNAVGSKEPLKVVIHESNATVVDTLPAPQIDKKCQCGVQNGASANRTHRIVGGRETLVNQYPWTLGIVNRFGKLPYCGASLISAEYVLTAQHCIEDEDLEDIVVVLNEHDFYNDTETVGRTLRRKVVEVIPYNYYMESTFFGDHALLRLERPVPISQAQFTPVCLPQSMTELFQGREALAAGWGTTNGGPFASKSPKLLEVPLVIYSNEACNDYHGHDPPEPPQVTDNMLCAGFSEGGRDTCAGDSGGALFVKMKENGRFSQIGVVSWGFGCAIRLNPGVFSRVSAFMWWIRLHTVDGHFCQT